MGLISDLAMSPTPVCSRSTNQALVGTRDQPSGGEGSADLIVWDVDGGKQLLRSRCQTGWWRRFKRSR